jgi:uncharacterized protein
MNELKNDRSEGRPIWIDLGTSDQPAARRFYEMVFGWDITVEPDPQYGGYAMARAGGNDVAGISGLPSPEAPTAWSLYIGVTDAAAATDRVRKAGGTVAVPPMAVGDPGTMAVFQDPAGAFICAWQPHTMRGFASGGPNSFAWGELSARGFDRVLPFYREIFGWTARAVPGGEGQLPYHLFFLGDEMVGGGTEMSPMVPPEVPSFWMVYFGVDDVDATHGRAVEAGGRAIMPPGDYPGGRVAILADPQGATFAIRSTVRRP